MASINWQGESYLTQNNCPCIPKESSIVQSAVASVWRISDKAAYELMIEFYQQLKLPKSSKASALQQAQIKMINNKTYAHPKKLGTFLVDWKMVLSLYL